MSQVELRGDEDQRNIRTEVTDLSAPFQANVLETRAVVDGEADEDGVRAAVGDGAKAVVVLLASRIPQHQLDPATVDLCKHNNNDE